ncbi:MAG: AAA family ATPase [Acidobacteriaceae bacterium]
MRNLTLLSFDIDNFRSIHNLHLEGLAGYNVFVGRNNVGKSNILHSINHFLNVLRGGKLGYRMDKAAATELFYQNTTDGLLLEGELELISGGFPKRCLAKVGASQTQAGTYTYVSELILTRKPEEQSESAVEFSFSVPQSDLDEYIRALQQVDQRRSEQTTAEAMADSISQSANDANKMLAGIRAHLAKHPSWSEESQSVVREFVAKPQLTVQEMRDFQAKLLASSKKGPALAREQAKKWVTSESALTFEGAFSDLTRLTRYHSGESREQFSSADRQRLFDLFTNRSSRYESRRFAQLVKDLLDVDIEIFREGDAPVVQLSEFLDAGNGSGIRGCLRLVFDLTEQKPQIALIEEPELHLHPTLARVVAGFLIDRSEGAQNFLTSHSAEFIDAGAADSTLFLVERADGHTVAKRTSLPEGTESIVTSLGLRPSSVLMYDRLMLVEGPSDEEVLRHLAKTLGLDLGGHGVGFIHLRGGKNFHFVSQDVLGYLERSHAHTWCVVDSDEMSRQEIDKCYAKFEGLAHANLSILRKREIENYLLQDRAILATINEKRAVAGLKPTVSIEDVRAALTELNSDFRQELIRLRARTEILPRIQFGHGIGIEDIAGQLSEIQTEVASRVQGLPLSLANITKDVNALPEPNLLERVPGSYVLTQVCRAFEVGFSKADSGALATHLRSAEIDEELKKILKDVAGD